MTKWRVKLGYVVHRGPYDHYEAGRVFEAPEAELLADGQLFKVEPLEAPAAKSMPKAAKVTKDMPSLEDKAV